MNSRTLETVISSRFVTRLGETPGTLSSVSVEKTVSAVKEFIAQISPYGALLHAFATSAVRDAKNPEALLAPLKELGVNVEVLSGEREAALACAVLPETGSCIDIGGGSTELLVKCEDRHVCRSYRAGAVRAKAVFETNAGNANIRNEHNVKAWLESIFTNDLPNLPTPVYGTGGTITTLAALITNRNHENLEGAKFTITQLKSTIEYLTKTDKSQLIAHPLLADRADIILYGAQILSHLMDVCDVCEIVVTIKDNLYAYLLD